MRKRCETALYNYRRKHPVKRLLLALAGRKPRLTGKIPSEGLILRVIQGLSSLPGIGKIIHLEDEKTISLMVRYDAGTLLPFVSITYYDCNTAYQENMQFLEWNSGIAPFFYSEGRPVQYPISEFGVTGLPDNLPEEAATIKEKYDSLLFEINAVLNDKEFKEKLFKIKTS